MAIERARIKHTVKGIGETIKIDQHSNRELKNDFQE